MCKCSNHKSKSRFIDIGSPNRVWAVPALHGDIDKLIPLHDNIFNEFEVGDKIVYLGNYTGYGNDAVKCIDEVLTFRRLLLALPAMKPSDITYLRGAQEEMWQKLLQLPFAPDPMNILLWMLGNGMSNTLKSYDICYHEGINACRAGTMALTKWCGKIREAIRLHAGHETFSSSLVRAAYTDENSDYPMLFVNAGIHDERTLDKQGDHLWWTNRPFEDINAPYLPFKKVIRGYDPKHNGLHLNCVTATIDGGCGFGGPLLAAAFEPNGDVGHMIEV